MHGRGYEQPALAGLRFDEVASAHGVFICVGGAVLVENIVLIEPHFVPEALSHPSFGEGRAVHLTAARPVNTRRVLGNRSSRPTGAVSLSPEMVRTTRSSWPLRGTSTGAAEHNHAIWWPEMLRWRWKSRLQRNSEKATKWP